jgi:hypothetical protein
MVQHIELRKKGKAPPCLEKAGYYLKYSLQTESFEHFASLCELKIREYVQSASEKLRQEKVVLCGRIGIFGTAPAGMSCPCAMCACENILCARTCQNH